VAEDPISDLGTATDRNFLRSRDIADGMILAAAKVTDASAINIGTAEHIKIRDAAELIFFKLTDFHPERMLSTLTNSWVFSRAADPARTVPCWVGNRNLFTGARKHRLYYGSHFPDSVSDRLDYFSRSVAS